MPVFARFLKPVARRAGSPAVVRAEQLLARRLEETAARLEAHTVNLAREQDRIAAEGLRGVITEVRANSTFIADAVAALERLGRAVDRLDAALAAGEGAGLVLRPHVHGAVAQAGPGPIAVVGVPDAALVRELVAAGRTVTIHPAPAAAATTGGHVVAAWASASPLDEASARDALALVDDGGCLVVSHDDDDDGAPAWTGLVVQRHAHLVDGRRVTVDRISRR